VKEYPIKLTIFKTTSEADNYVSEQILNQITSKENSVISLPTGATQIGMYRQLVDKINKKRVNLNAVKIFNLDEYWPIKQSHPSSYFSYMKKNLIDLIDFPSVNWFIPNSEAFNPDQAAEEYQLNLDRNTPRDMVILGLGPGKTCHIAFNERGSAADSKTRYIRNLDNETINVNSGFFSNNESMPKGAITQGISDILNSRKIILLAKGETKAWGINRMLTGDVNSDAPASFLRLHSGVEIVIDELAGIYLPLDKRKQRVVK